MHLDRLIQPQQLRELGRAAARPIHAVDLSRFSLFYTALRGRFPTFGGNTNPTVAELSPFGSWERFR
jgi:hypothetical protein